jgi:hypothetical protein
MSGKKRALVGLDPHLGSRLAELESRLGSLQAGHSAVQERVAALLAQEESLARSALAARQHAVRQTMDKAEQRFIALENRTAALLAQHQHAHALASRHSEIRMNQVNTILSSLVYELEQQQSAAQNVWVNAEQTLEAAKTLEEGLCAYYPSPLWQTILPRIHAWIEEAEANLYRGQEQAALLAAQQAYLDLQELRFNMEAHLQHMHLLRQSAIQRLNEVLALAESNILVQAVDLNGQYVDTWIDVDDWSGGLLHRLRHRISALLEQVSNPAQLSSEPEWHELLEEQVPGLEQALCAAVGLARRAVITSQLRFNVAEKVVSALAQQGYALVDSGWQEGEQQDYLAALQDYNGSQVIVRISSPAIPGRQPSPEQACQLDISYHSPEILSEYLLQGSVGEIYASLRAAGLDVNAPAKPTGQNPVTHPRPLQLPQPVLQFSNP